MGIINFVGHSNILVDIIIIAIIGANAYYGYVRGLVNVFLKIIMFIVSIAIMFVLYKPVSNIIINNTSADEFISYQISQNISNINFDNSQFLDYDENKNLSEGVVNKLNQLIKDAMKKSTTNIIEQISQNLSIEIIRALTMLGLFIIARIILFFVKITANFITKLPILKTLNRSGGLVYGFLKGLLITYIILAVFSITSPLIYNWGIIDAINTSHLGKIMYNDNFIINTLLK